MSLWSVVDSSISRRSRFLLQLSRLISAHPVVPDGLALIGLCSFSLSHVEKCLMCLRVAFSAFAAYTLRLPLVPRLNIWRPLFRRDRFLEVVEQLHIVRMLVVAFPPDIGFVESRTGYEIPDLFSVDRDSVYLYDVGRGLMVLKRSVLLPPNFEAQCFFVTYN